MEEKKNNLSFRVRHKDSELDVLDTTFCIKDVDPEKHNITNESYSKYWNVYILNKPHEYTRAEVFFENESGNICGVHDFEYEGQEYQYFKERNIDIDDNIDFDSVVL